MLFLLREPGGGGSLCGVLRIGLVAKGLLIKDDMDLERQRRVGELGGVEGRKRRELGRPASPLSSSSQSSSPSSSGSASSGSASSAPPAAGTPRSQLRGS